VASESVDTRTLAAAERLRGNLEDAKEGGYYNNGWYARMAKWDIEALIDHVLGPLPVAEPEPEPEPEEREKFTLTITGSDGRVIRTVEVDEEDFDTLVDEDETRVYVTGTGQRLVNVHKEEDCIGRHCVIHNPSPHYMADYPTNWRADRGIMERICEHGVGHPDPDDMEFIRLTRGEESAHVESVHGCDGCCTPKDRRHPHLRGEA